MKKTLVAIAALAATGAFAQSSVAITGVFDAGYQAISHTDATKKWSGINNNGTNTSRLDFQGTEDLGGGLKASFWGELDINPVRSTTLNQNPASNGQSFTGTPFTGQQFVAIAGGFGDLKIGQPNSPALDIGGGVMQPFGTALGSGYSGTWGRLGTEAVSGVNSYVGGSTGRIIRHEKTAVYTTPVFNGFKAQVEYSFQNDKSANTVSNDNGYQSLAAHYNNGPLNVSALTATAKSGAVAAAGTAPATATIAGKLGINSDVKWNMLGGNYTVGAFTGYAGYTTTKTTGVTAVDSDDSKSSNISGKYVMGNVDLLASYIKRTSNLTAPTSGAVESKLTAVGANYNLSKTSFVYYRYEHLTGLTSVATNQSQTTNALGLAVKF